MSTVKSTVGWIGSPQFLEHDTGPGHPEGAERLISIDQRLAASGLAQELTPLAFEPILESEVASVHAPGYAGRIRAEIEQGRSYVDAPDVPVCPTSYSSALAAAGAARAAARAVARGTIESTFVAARPPGHHAEESSAAGFCLLNNVALAARYAQAELDCPRVAIVDWDVHHGNGTQHLFESDASVFYASLHQYPHYPGTGSRGERGLGDGLGTTLNCPQAAHSSDREWLASFTGEVLPAIESFAPDLVLVSAGFDAHHLDPLSDVNLTTSAYGEMTRSLLQVARETSGRGLVSVLEGGYHLEGLASSVEEHLRALLGV